VVKIPKQAFRYPRKLKRVDCRQASALRCIGEHAFVGCPSLVTVELSPSVRVIEGWAFANCSALEVVTFGGKGGMNLTTISDGAFLNCKKLRSIDLGNAKGLKCIGESAFYGCESLNTMTIASRASTCIIQREAFARCSALKQVTLSDRVQRIDDYAFSECTSLESVIIPPKSKLDTIGVGLFFLSSSLKQITLPPSLPGKYVEWSNPFFGCRNLKTKDNDVWIYNGVGTIPCQVRHVKVDRTVVLLTREMTTRWNYPSDRLQSLLLSDGLQHIDKCLFWGYRNLKNVIVPSSVNFFDLAFLDESLESIDVRGKNLSLSIRLKLLYPDASHNITMDRLISMYASNPIQELNVQPDYFKYGEPWRREQRKLKEVENGYVEAIRQLVLWSVGKGIIEKAAVSDLFEQADC
jgi:hypothetical protein